MVAPTTPCFDYEGEVLLGDSDQYLGDFRDVFNPGPPFLPVYGPAIWPVGWTGNGEFQVHYFGACIPIFTANGATGLHRLAVVNDVTGPPGLESVAAAEMFFSGDAGSGMVFMGEYPGCLSGWTVTGGDCWFAQFWAKAVPDDNGFVADGYTLSAKGADPANVGNNLGVTWVTGGVLTTSWAFHSGFMNWPNPLSFGPNTFSDGQFAIGTAESNTGVPKGAMHVKCPHLYPCEAGLINDYGIHEIGIRRRLKANS